MKPIVTLAVLANARTARIVENHGPSKGFTASAGHTLQAPPAVENADRAGSHPISGAHGAATFEASDPKETAEAVFARLIVKDLEKKHAAEAFDQLILTAAPHMLGQLRAALPDALKSKVIGEADKDLTHAGLDDIAGHLKDIIAA
ncbi:host attachment protein (plasmid) [Leisingera sp. M527]|uniref:host attachment protein n=1 Tax=Leisingera sp. M527 TaxID=2867014 RepID=UPI0021A2BCD4|nr:host attachment protein [Leisingera sp. M527]UWQ35654.1 host attachment protein [Leisingera sp. M527]